MNCGSNFNETDVVYQFIYYKVASSNTSHLDAHAGFSRLLMKGIIGPYVQRPFEKKLIS